MQSLESMDRNYITLNSLKTLHSLWPMTGDIMALWVLAVSMFSINLNFSNYL